MKIKSLLLVLTAAFPAACAHRPALAPIPVAVMQTSEARQISEAYGKNWIVSTQGRAATLATKRIFDEGGNMIDAAVAASFVIGVERPHSTGLGGGGFMIYRQASSGKTYAIDFRERAPARARERMFLDERGEVIPNRSVYGIHAVGIPGLVRGLSAIHRKFGRLPFEKVMQPAIELAADGFPIYPSLAAAIEGEKVNLAHDEHARAIFLTPNGEPRKVGDILRQSELAATLRRIARTHGEDFYSGVTAGRITAALPGWITRRDLQHYRVHWREPVHSTFRGREIFAMPPPSSGGTHVIEILNLLENRGLKAFGFLSPEAVHQSARAMQFAFHDRALVMGDPDFVRVPTETLTSKDYARKLQASFPDTRALRADDFPEKFTGDSRESSETTHFSMMDAEGNAVASTQTINGHFGAVLMAGDSGILLNNEMDDFSTKPGAANIYGAIGSKANSVQPAKTPLSSMSPTLITKDGRPEMVIGAPGGTRIITCVAESILNYFEFGMPLYESIAAVRFHDQWKPDEITYENGMPETTVERLQSLGYVMRAAPVGCIVMGVTREGDRLHGVSDPRDNGMALGDR